ncbi:hypothetical protein DM02DRAFT_657078 [Periconia macrospinosa]|uniref:Uncharacterized protein n=1 Tax=Periconia macrospinosa TaxID=97972 RepID=A0A2V1DLZ9_9PLEO|nr:hypothetical protein DM02DRAFT_657078 [Periconia macrospinosa]
MAAVPITPGAIGVDVQARLRINPVTNCACGVYVYYSSVCGHVYQEVQHKCGQRTTKSGVPGFCKVPAPRNIVAAPQHLTTIASRHSGSALLQGTLCGLRGATPTGFFSAASLSFACLLNSVKSGGGGVCVGVVAVIVVSDLSGLSAILTRHCGVRFEMVRVGVFPFM